MEIFVLAGVENGARRIDHQARSRHRPPGPDGGFDITTLGADAWHQQRHVANDFADAGDFAREGGADDQRDLTGSIPFTGRQTGDALVEFLAANVEELQVGTAWVRGAAKQDYALFTVRQPGLERIAAHIGVDRDGVGLKALEGLAGVLLGSGANVAALGVENDRDAWMLLVNVGDQRFELIFGAAGSKVGNLRLEGTDQVGGGVYDGRAEFKDGIVVALTSAPEVSGELGRIGVEADAE